MQPKAARRAKGGRFFLDLALSERVPYRVFTLTGPDRLVVDVKGAPMGGIEPDRFAVDGLSGARFGLFSPGWARIVADLEAPFQVTSATYEAGSTLRVALKATSPEAFAAASGAPEGLEPYAPPAPDQDVHNGRLRIAIDAGHGGIDPGATRGGVVEKDIVLRFAREFADLAARDGRFDVLLIRDGDYYVSLSQRVQRARDAQADLFVSVHADTVERGHASGATVYTLSKTATDQRTAEFAARENASDAKAGLDTRTELDAVHNVLADMAALETNARSRDFAEQLVEELRVAVGVLSTDPHRSAGFWVLKAHDMPSVLLELGFLTSQEDRLNLTDKTWRADAGAALLEAIALWAEADADRREKMFQ